MAHVILWDEDDRKLPITKWRKGKWVHAVVKLKLKTNHFSFDRTDRVVSWDEDDRVLPSAK